MELGPWSTIIIISAEVIVAWGFVCFVERLSKKRLKRLNAEENYEKMKMNYFEARLKRTG